MSFSFRRSSSFGPFRLNFSKSGVGASVGVKGARVTLTPKGRTYITVGAGGFSYRQNLATRQSSAPARPQLEPLQETSFSDEIKTADVEALRESSKSELAEDLNRRAAMFNPAIILFVLAGLVGLVGMVMFTSALPARFPALPQITSDRDGTRQANATDEYALLIARYGQPSAVQIEQAGSTPVRSATWDSAHLTVRLVPVGCVAAFGYFEMHKNDSPAIHAAGRRRHAPRTETAAAPTCSSGASKASTIVAYEDGQSHTAVDALSAAGSLAGLNHRSAALPILSVAAPTPVRGRSMKVVAPPKTLEYDEPTFKSDFTILKPLASRISKLAQNVWPERLSY